MPMFVSMHTMRRGGALALAAAPNEGRMASRNGKVSATPVPRRKVRRERAERVKT